MRVILCGPILGLILTSTSACLAGEDSARVVGPNLVTNGNFEQGTAGWNGSAKIVAQGAYEGHQAAVLDNTAGQKRLSLVQAFVPLKPKTYYRFSMAVRRTNGQGYIYVHGDYRESAETRLMSSKNWSAGRAMPVTIRTGEGTGDWHRFSGVFRCDRPEFGGIHLVIFIANGDDVVYLDDVRIEELRYADAPAWDFAKDLALPGRPSRFGMRVEQATIDSGRLTVRTTGAEYRLDPGAGILSCRQRIGSQREVAEVRLAGSLPRLAILSQDEDLCLVRAGELGLAFHGDSLVCLASNGPLQYTITSRIGAKHFAATDQHLLAIDDEGAFCALTHARPFLNSAGSLMAAQPAETAQPGWKAEYRIAAWELGALAVCPARPFDWDKSFNRRIVSTAGYPKDDEALREFSRQANVLFLFNQFYRDQPAGKWHAPYAVADPQRLRDTIRLAHELKMQVICYQHPTSYAWAGIPLDDALAFLRRFRQEYGFDGWYFDGLYYEGDWMETYRFIRAIREEAGPDGIIYTHCTLNPPSRMCTLYSPFIDSYSDFLLRGEGQTIHGTKDPYLRYVVGTYQISNAIATLKGDKMLRDGAEEPAAPPGKTLSQEESRSRWREAGASLQEQLDAMLRINGRCRWAYPAWPLKPDRDPYLGFYFPELQRLRAQWEKDHQPQPVRWP